MATIPPQEHILLDLTCPHCHKMNLLAVVLLYARVPALNVQLSAPIARKPGRRQYLGPAWAGRFPSSCHQSLLSLGLVSSPSQSPQSHQAFYRYAGQGSVRQCATSNAYLHPLHT